MSLSQLIEKRRQAQELQEVQQRQAPMRGNADFAAGARNEHDHQKQEEMRESQFREHNLGRGAVTVGEIDTWHEQQRSRPQAQRQVDHKAERDWEAQILPKMDDQMLPQHAKKQQQDQEQRRKLTR